MLAPHASSHRLLGPLFSSPPALFAVFVFALDVLVAFLLTVAVLLAVCILWRTKTSPRHTFILDLLNAETSFDHTSEVFPVHKAHVPRRAA